MTIGKGAKITLPHASDPMIQFLSEAYYHDSSSLDGDIGKLFALSVGLTLKKARQKKERKIQILNHIDPVEKTREI